MSTIQNKDLYELKVGVLQGVGPVKAEELHQLGIESVAQLFAHFPYRYEDRRLKNPDEAIHDDAITLKGTVQSEPSLRFYGRKKSRLSFHCIVDGQMIQAVLFNRHFAKKQFKPGTVVILYGKWNQHRAQITVQTYIVGKKAEDEHDQGYVPVYSGSSAVGSSFLKQLIEQAWQDYESYIVEILPQTILTKYELVDRKEAILSLHMPHHAEDSQQAKRRMMYEEFFLFQLKMHALKKRHRDQIPGQAKSINGQAMKSFINDLPFELTNAQKRVVDEIMYDLSSPHAMNRLLQGDVGSGKTIVAALSCWASYLAGYQCAFMVPTEILAEQHSASLLQLFANTELQIGRLTGQTTARERKALLAGIRMGTIDVLIGTHALIQEDVFFQKLGLVVTDEQHRFGVHQRQILRQKGNAPDVLFMTATPIPRTLSITVFGDLDVSILDEMPKGRKPIETYWIKEDKLDRLFRFIEQELNKGRQAYVICPLIEESDTLDLQNAIEFHVKLSKRFERFRVGLLHSRLHAHEKEQVMHHFKNNDVHLLVSTTVVEVGVDVPNATLMVIQDAQRFGLSQLHQLRGRVGRGNEQSYCILIADPKTEGALERMNIMQSTNDGFEVARQDLRLRGPGDFFGTKQSGLPEFRFGDLLRDHKALEVARQDAADLIRSEPFWEDKQYAHLRQYLKREGVLEQSKLD